MMNHITRLLLFLCLSLPCATNAQLPDGSIAPDWTHNDIFGNQHHLYNLLAQGKMVVIEFSATWCGPCWNYMLTGALEDFWNEHGPNGDNTAQVFYIEADQNTGIDDLYGLTSGSQGNWVANIPFPIIDLQVGENTDNQYGINYYPTLYAVCADHTLWELGQVPASEWEEFLTSCTLAGEVSDVQDAICYGDGNATLDVSGGITPITYSWSNGDNGPTLDNVGAGNYSVTITEGNQKFIVLDDIIIDGQDAPISLASSDVENALCNGSSTGSISISLMEGTPPFAYDWSNGAQSQNLNNIPADVYTVLATDDNGCTFQASFTVNEPAELSVESVQTADYCGDSNGTITLDISGGVGSYSITSSEGTVSGNQVINLPSGSVDVEVEDGNGCVWEDTYEIEAVVSPELSFTPDPIVTCANPVTVVQSFVTLGSGDYTYAWSTTNGHIVGPVNQSSVTVDQAGDYNLQVYDFNSGCDVAGSSTVMAVIQIPVASAGDDGSLTCETQQVTLSGNGDSTFVISWTSPDGNIVSGGNTYNPIVDAPGQYIMSVFNPATSCSTTDTAAVINAQQPVDAAYAYQTTALTMIGTDQSTGSNVTNQQWTFGDGGTGSGPSVIHTYSTAGTYQVCLVVENGCGTDTTCQQVEVSFVGSVISVDAAIGNVACQGNATGSIVLQVNGGSGVYTYSWTGPGGATYNTPSLADVVAGTYQLVISDDVGNLFIGEFVITEPTAIVLANATTVNNLCYGQANGSLTVDIMGGVGPYSYSFNGGPVQAENFINNLPSDSIQCLVLDANGCPFEVGPYAITSPPALETTEVQVTDAENESQNNGSITIVVAGGVEPYAVAWSNGATGTTISGLTPGEYNYVITDANGCTLASANPIVIAGIVATQDIAWARQISATPNPSTGNVMIRWSDMDQYKGQMTLYTAQGKKVSARKLAAAEGSWDLTSLTLPSGIYTLVVECNRQIVPIKLVILQ